MITDRFLKYYWKLFWNSWFSWDFWIDYIRISSNFLLRNFFLINIYVKCTNFIKFSCIFTVFRYLLFIFYSIFSLLFYFFSPFFLLFFYPFHFLFFFFLCPYRGWGGVDPPLTNHLRTPLHRCGCDEQSWSYLIWPVPI